MQTWTSGGPALCGDVRYGAGKGTGVGDPVKNFTDHGARCFGNLVSAPILMLRSLSMQISDSIYTVYPEQLGYNTTAWTSLNVNPFKTS